MALYYCIDDFLVSHMQLKYSSLNLLEYFQRIFNVSLWSQKVKYFPLLGSLLMSIRRNKSDDGIMSILVTIVFEFQWIEINRMAFNILHHFSEIQISFTNF